MYDDNILSSIDLITESVSDASLSVLESMIMEYDKMSYLMEENIFMEGDILDEATGKGKVESGIIKVLAFVPRLLRSVVRAIGNFFTGGKKEQINGDFNTVEKNMDKLSGNQLAQYSNDINNNSNGNITFDPNKKKFVLGEVFRGIRNSIFIVAGAAPVFKKVVTKIKGGDTGYENFANEIKNIITGQKKLDNETLEYTVQTLKELVDDGGNACFAIRGISDELAQIIELKLQRDYKNGKGVDQKQVQLKAMLDNITTVTKHTSRVLKLIKWANFAIDKFANPIKRWLKNKFAVDPEDVEQSKLKTEENAAKAGAREQTERRKDLEKDLDRREDKTNDMALTEGNIKNAQKKMKKEQIRADKAEKKLSKMTNKLLNRNRK